MPAMKITKRGVEALTAPEKLTIFWDQDLSGFGLKATPAGGKTYVVQYRMGGRGSPTRRYTIGSEGTWTAPLARAEAERLLRMAASGIDPQTAAKEREQAAREFAFAPYAERFLAEYGGRHWRARTYASAESNMRRWVNPVLGRKAVPAIT